MTEQTQEQGYTLWDAAAIASTIVGIAAVVLAVFLPGNNMGAAIVAIIVALVLAIGAGNAASKAGQRVSWFSRIGSVAAAVAIVVLVVGQLT